MTRSIREQSDAVFMLCFLSSLWHGFFVIFTFAFKLLSRLWSHFVHTRCYLVG